MKLKWIRYKTTCVLMRLGTSEIAWFWVPEAWIARRKMYEDLAVAWYAYRFEERGDIGAYIGTFDSLGEAKKAAEAAITSRA